MIKLFLILLPVICLVLCSCNSRKTDSPNYLNYKIQSAIRANFGQPSESGSAESLPDFIKSSADQAGAGSIESFDKYVVSRSSLGMYFDYVLYDSTRKAVFDCRVFVD
jgi:hypothetical protein